MWPCINATHRFELSDASHLPGGGPKHKKPTPKTKSEGVVQTYADVRRVFGSTGSCSHSPLRGRRERSILPTADGLRDGSTLRRSFANTTFRRSWLKYLGQRSVRHAEVQARQGVLSCLLRRVCRPLKPHPIARIVMPRGPLGEQSFAKFAMPLQAHSRASGPLTAPL